MRLGEPNRAARRTTAGPSVGPSRALGAPLTSSCLDSGTRGAGGRRKDEFWIRCGRRFALRALPERLAIERPRPRLWGLDRILEAITTGACDVVAIAQRPAAALRALASDLDQLGAMAQDLRGSIR